MTPPDTRTGSGAGRLLARLTADRRADGDAPARAVIAGIAHVLGATDVVLVDDSVDPGLLDDVVSHRVPAGTALPPQAGPRLVLVDADHADMHVALPALFGEEGLRDGVVVVAYRGEDPPAALARSRPTAVPKVAYVDERFLTGGPGHLSLAVIVVDAGRAAYDDPPAAAARGVTAPSSTPPVAAADLARIALLESQLQASRVQAGQLRAERDAVVASRSWRMGGPLRRVQAVLRRLRPR